MFTGIFSNNKALFGRTNVPMFTGIFSKNKTIFGRTNVPMFTGIFRLWVIVFNATFNNISVVSRRSALLVEETGVPGENHRSFASYWETLSHNVVDLFEKYQASHVVTKNLTIDYVQTFIKAKTIIMFLVITMVSNNKTIFGVNIGTLVRPNSVLLLLNIPVNIGTLVRPNSVLLLLNKILGYHFLCHYLHLSLY
jgi:hypothetical protein